MFDDRNYETILTEALAEGKALGVDVREGSIYYDAVVSTCFQIARFYADLKTAFDLVAVTTAVGEYLDRKGEESNVYRSPATSACYQCLYAGARPATGERFFAEGRYYVLRNSEKHGLSLEAELTGVADNGILAGTPAVPVNNISGLTSSTFGELIEPGVDVENDESYRQRIREKVAGPAENGNRQHYKTWCEEVTGVGRARIIPLFAGANTVLAVITGTDGTPAADAVVERVQDYVDPFPLGSAVTYEGRTIVLGPGLGNGVANIGAHFAAISAAALPITVSLKVELASGSTLNDAIEEASKTVTAYLKDLALNTADSEVAIVRLSTVGTLLHALPSVIDYGDLTFNGTASNIEVSGLVVAVLEEVIISEII